MESAPSMIFLLLEANPLLLINQGIGFNAEWFLTSRFSLGAVGEYYDQEHYDTDGVQATREAFVVGPQARWYFFDFSGPFIGTKLLFSQNTSTISDSSASSSDTITYIAPVADVGFRFILSDMVSFSMYVGMGFKSMSTSLPESMIPADRAQNELWQSALSELNTNQSRTYVDYGFTLGFLL
jgi:hypothetical protein